VSSEATAGPTLLDAAGSRARHAHEIVTSLRPLYVLGAFVLVQWVAVLALALTVRHNGWLYYAGGDQLWHYSGAYLMAHGHLPPSYVGYGWSILLLPISAIAGPNLVSALPAIVLLNTLVLLPVALLCIYGIAARVAGRLFGYFAAAVWTGLPYLGIVFVETGYHQKYTELTLPQLTGLTPVPDFPATVGLIVAAYFCMRALDSAGWQYAAAAGLATGYSIAIKPSNSIFLVAPALLFIVEKRRALIPFALALGPPLLTLALWKLRGLGELAAAPAEQVRLASGAGDLLSRIHRPSLNSWEHLHQVLLGLREHFWVARVIEWLPIAGAIALALRSLRGMLLIGGWFTVFLLAKGTYIPASVEDASFFRIMMPSFPAYVLLAASIVLLFPGVRAMPEELVPKVRPPRLTHALVAAVVVFALVPVAVIAAVPALNDDGKDALIVGDSLLPVDPGVQLTGRAEGDSVTLTWDESRPGSGFYRILRSKTSNDVACAGVTAADQCRIYPEAIATTRDNHYVDSPGSGTWTYRVGVAANWLDDETLGDVYVVSRPATVTVP
jgi:hypothetical protein